MAIKKQVEIVDEPNLTVEEIEQFILDAGSDDLTVFGGKWKGGVFAQQNSDELAPCLFHILNSGIKINGYLEIGAAAGGTTYLINHFLHPKGIVIVDDGQHPRAWMRKTILAGINYENIQGMSYQLPIIEAAKQFAPYDLIFVDADHSYPSVRADITCYLPMLSSGGFMIMHDSTYFKDDVGRVVKELQSDPQVEFIAEYLSKKYQPLGTSLFRKV
jgi:predicted O-methyltransferase YrrM